MIDLIYTHSKLVGYAISVALLIQLAVFFARHHVLPDLRGKDKTWQFIEISGVIWLYLFPGLAVVSLFGLDVPTGVWSTMDIVYFVNIMGRNANRFIEARFGIPQDLPKENEPGLDK